MKLNLRTTFKPLRGLGRGKAKITNRRGGKRDSQTAACNLEGETGETRQSLGKKQGNKLVDWDDGGRGR